MAKRFLYKIWGIIIFVFLFFILTTVIIDLYRKNSLNKPFKPLDDLEIPKILEPIYSNAIFIVEQKTGSALFSKNPDALIPPASLTKLVSLYLAYEKIEQGVVKKTDLVPVSINAWAKMLPTDATRMFLEPGQKPTLMDIMLGVALPSGNDASIALAEFLAQDVTSFINQMNLKVKELGFKHMHFEDPNGLSNSNYVTAREFTNFSNLYITKFPQSITDLHSVKTFTYPRKENFAPYHWGRRRSNSLPNHNPLLGHLEGVDGLKTGFISKSGLNIAITAKRGNMRIVASILGSFGKRGNSNRMKDAKKLVNFIYDTYSLEEDLFTKDFEVPKKFKYLSSARISPEINAAVMFKGEYKFETIFNRYNPFSIKNNDVVGYIKVTDHSGRYARYPLVADQTTSKQPTSFLEYIFNILFKILSLGFR